ncbi:hypothetical protein [Marinicella sp. W31]|uniref:hypothetical protein n=1 Tax=Marinicella sp. W31 TaxID=3023713 RepID=UPI0037583AB0
MQDFKPIGFHIRINDEEARHSADCMEWDCDDLLIEQVIKEIDIQENCYQLLQPENAETYAKLVSMVQANENRSLILLSILEEDSGYFKEHDTTEKLYIDTNADVQVLGLDVCDVNGLFSALFMQLKGIEGERLLEKDNLELANKYKLLANSLVPEHSPFGVMLVKEILIK